MASVAAMALGGVIFAGNNLSAYLAIGMAKRGMKICRLRSVSHRSWRK